MLFQYWTSAVGGGPILKQHWVMSSCLLGTRYDMYMYLPYLYITQISLPTGFVWHDICHVAVHIQCSKLFKEIECTVLLMVLCTIKNLWSHFWIRVAIVPASGFLLSRFCNGCAKSDVKQYSLTYRFYCFNHTSTCGDDDRRNYFGYFKKKSKFYFHSSV